MGDPLGLKAYLAMAKLVGLLILLALVCYQSSQIHKWHKQADGQSLARQRDHDAYVAAQAIADAKHKAKVQQIEKQQDSINEKARSDYRRDLDRLRAQSRTDQGVAGGSKAPGVPKAAPGADGQAGVPLSTPELLRAAELELQLDKLIDWVDQQLKVER